MLLHREIFYYRTVVEKSLKLNYYMAIKQYALLAFRLDLKSRPFGINKGLEGKIFVSDLLVIGIIVFISSV